MFPRMMFLLIFLVPFCFGAPTIEEPQKYDGCKAMEAIKLAVCMGKTLFTAPSMDEAQRLNITDATAEQLVMCKRMMSCIEEIPCSKDDKTEYLKGKCGILEYIDEPEFENCEEKITEASPEFFEDEERLGIQLLDHGYEPENCPKLIKALKEMKEEMNKNCEKNVWENYFEHIKKLPLCSAALSWRGGLSASIY